MTVEDLAPRLEAIEGTLAQLLQRQMSAQPPGSVQLWSPRPGLSPRELELLPYAAAGLSNDEIAEVLVVSERTIREHFTHMLGKMGCHNRTTLSMWALLGGLVTSDEIIELWRQHRPHLVGDQ